MKNKEYNLGVLQDLKSAICFNLVNDPMEKEIEQALDMAIEALEQESKADYRAFAEWVAREIFNDMWEYNKDAFAELACRKLAKLGVVRVKGDEWELVELQAEKEEVE